MNLIKYFLVFLPLISYSQNSDTQPVKSVNIVTTDTVKCETVNGGNITISIKKGEEQIIHDQNYYLSEIKKIDDHILSIDTKINWVKENGVVDFLWLSEMNKIKSELIQEKSKLLKLIN